MYLHLNMNRKLCVFLFYLSLFFSEMKEFSDIQRKIAQGFTNKMYNARGRQMVETVFDKLFSGSEDISVLNVGGSSRNDACVKVYFPQINKTPLPSLYDTLPEKDSGGELRVLTRKGLRKRYDMEYLQSPKDVYKAKTFVPDAVVEMYGESTTLTLLTISVKSGSHITTGAYNQLKYELLPVLLRQKQALGLVICAKEASLLLYSIVDKEARIHVKKYRFCSATASSFNVAQFEQMCFDSIYYAKKVGEECDK